MCMMNINCGCTKEDVMKYDKKLSNIFHLHSSRSGQLHRKHHRSLAWCRLPIPFHIADRPSLGGLTFLMAMPGQIVEGNKLRTHTSKYLRYAFPGSRTKIFFTRSFGSLRSARVSWPGPMSVISTSKKLKFVNVHTRTGVNDNLVFRTLWNKCFGKHSRCLWIAYHRSAGNNFLGKKVFAPQFYGW